MGWFSHDEPKETSTYETTGESSGRGWFFGVGINRDGESEGVEIIADSEEEANDVASGITIGRALSFFTGMGRLGSEEDYNDE